MFKSFMGMLGRMLDKWLVGTFILFALLLLWLPWRVIPDYFHLQNIKDKKDTVFKLLTTLIGSSSIMLTLLLVGYNFYVKTTRRFTLEFVSDNRWLKLLLSLFFGLSAFLGIGFCVLETNTAVNNITFLYCSYGLTIFFLLALFPMALLTLHESNSLDNIQRILHTVTAADIDNLYAARLGELTFAGLEKNPLLILKDLCASAVVEKDYSIAETVLTHLYKKLILPLRENSTALEVNRAMYVWAFFVSHLKREVIKQDDIATADKLWSLTMNIHHHFAEQRILHLRGNTIDYFIKDFARLMIERNVFAELQTELVPDVVTVIESYYNSLKYTDKEIPTVEYSMAEMDVTVDTLATETPPQQFWFYLQHDLIDVLSEIFQDAIDHKRKAVYAYAFAGVQQLMNAIMDSDGMTVYQKQNASRTLLDKSTRLTEYAISHQVYDRIEPVSDAQLQIWFEKDVVLAWDGLHAYVRMMRELQPLNVELGGHVERLFLLCRALERRGVPSPLLNQVVEYIVKTAIDFADDGKTSGASRRAIVHKLEWFLASFINRKTQLVPVKEKYETAIAAVLLRFDAEPSSQ